MVGQPAPDMIRVVLRFLEERSQVMIVYFVVDDVPLAPRPHQASVSQQAQLVGHAGLGNAGEERKVSDTERSRQQRIKNSHAGRIGKGLEGFSHDGKDFWGWKSTACLVECLRIDG